MTSPDEIRKIAETENCACVFIDDTGSPGQIHNLSHLPDNWFTWVGIIIPPCLGREVFDGMSQLLKEGKKKWGVDEFHFTKIYQRKDVWELESMDERMKVFSYFADIIKEKQLQFVNATLADRNDHLKGHFSDPLILKGKKMDDPKILSLYVLLYRVDQVLKELGYDNALIVIDEEIQTKGTKIKCKRFPSTFRHGEVHFASSKEVAPLQLADFAAYSFNRMQLICGRITELLKEHYPGDVKFYDTYNSLSDHDSNAINRMNIIRKKIRELLEEHYPNDIKFIDAVYPISDLFSHAKEIKLMVKPRRN